MYLALVFTYVCLLALNAVFSLEELEPSNRTNTSNPSLLGRSTIKWTNTSYSYPVGRSAFTCPDGAPLVGIEYIEWVGLSVMCATPFQHTHSHPTNHTVNYHDTTLPQLLHCQQDSFVSGVFSSLYTFQMICNSLLGWTMDIDNCFWSKDLLLYHCRRANDSFILEHGFIVTAMTVKSVPTTLHYEWRFKYCWLKEIRCELPRITNGRTSADVHSDVFSGSHSTGVYRLPNETVYVSCDAGNYLDNASMNGTMHCTSNGTWDTIPTCKRCRLIRDCIDHTCKDGNKSKCLRCKDRLDVALELSASRRKCIFAPILSIEPLLLNGTMVTITCSVRGRPSPSLRWSHRGLTIVNDNGYLVEKNRLTILNVTAQYTGWYYCIATNDAGQVTASVNVKQLDTSRDYQIRPTVEYSPPEIQFSDHQWTDLFRAVIICDVMINSSVSMPCFSIGNPLPIITWRYINLRNLEEILPNGTLIIDHVEKEDKGYYRCEARNLLGADSINYILLVKDADDNYYPGSLIPGTPNISLIIDWSSNYTVNLGETLLLHCNISSQPNVSVVWRKGQHKLSPELVVEGTLHLPPVTRVDAGEYSCLAIDDVRVIVDVRVTKVIVMDLLIVAMTTLLPPTIPTEQFTSNQSNQSDFSSWSCETSYSVSLLLYCFVCVLLFVM